VSDHAELRYWREILVSEAIGPAAKHKVNVDDLVQEALVGIWNDRARWKWPPQPSTLARFLYGLAKELKNGARNEARRRHRAARKPKAAQIPVLCGQLRNLLARARTPRQSKNLIVSAAMMVAPAELPKGRYREADLAWREGKPLGDIATTVGATRSVVSKRLKRASETLEGTIFDSIRNALSGRAARALEVFRRKATLPATELAALAEEVASVLEASRCPDESDSDDRGTHPGENRIL
jgi:DNA-directed RNA polymerase specialized sigma24 family protein